MQFAWKKKKKQKNNATDIREAVFYKNIKLFDAGDLRES